jgi:hypothetical protein
MHLSRLLALATPAIAALFLAGNAAAFEFRSYYEPEDIASYQDALKRKNFRAQVQHRPLLVAAADNGDINTVRWMLENNEKADTAAATGRTGLFHLASRNATKIPKEYAQIARLLLVHGADPNRHALGSSVIRTQASGNRDVATLQILLDYGAHPDGHPRDERPPVCGAATPAILDALVNAGAQLAWPERSDFRNVADCLALDDMDKKERKAMLRHLETVYALVPGGEKAPDNALKPWQPQQAGQLPAGNWLYSEHHWATPAWQQKAQVTMNYVVLTTTQPMARDAIIATKVQPERFRNDGWNTAGAALQRCVKRCEEELADWQQFTTQNRLLRTLAQHAPADAPVPAASAEIANESSAGEALPAEAGATR